MIPTGQYEEEEQEAAGLEYAQYPNRTYKMDVVNRVIVGMCDDVDAYAQAIYKIVNTEILRYPGYDGAYGTETDDLIGADRVYVESELQDRLEEAILADDRFESVEILSSEWERDHLHMEIRVTARDGDTVDSEVSF